MVEVTPYSVEASTGWIGSMKDEIEICGDILSAANESEEWIVLQE
jgi:hypothetical protein